MPQEFLGILILGIPLNSQDFKGEGRIYRAAGFAYIECDTAIINIVKYPVIPVPPLPILLIKGYLYGTVMLLFRYFPNFNLCSNSFTYV